MQAGVVLALLFVPIGAVWGQDGDALPVEGQPELRIPFRKPSALVVLKGMPYSGVIRSETLQIRQDGTRIQRTDIPHREFRDSQGRTRREQWFPPDRKDGVRIVTIDDPAAKVEFVLETGKKIAHRFEVDDSQGAPVDDATIQSESLGTGIVQGLQSDGVRRHIPVPALGDTPAREVVMEIWRASDSGVVMREHTADPVRGDTTAAMTNLRTEEPPALLFRVPPDYRIVEEPADFAITYSSQSEVTPPQVVTRVPAKYTEPARRAGVQGVVVLSVAIDRTGRARDVQVTRGIDPGLDDEAIKAVKQWRFRPGEQDGRPVRVNAHVEITFSLLN